MGKSLIRSKALDDFRFDVFFRIAVDGVCFFHSKKPHCDHCLRKKHRDGQIDYFHYALVAMIVAPNGLVIPLECEFIENTDEHGKPLYDSDNEFKKQDCEQNAFKRLAKKIKLHYPRLPICILADGLYCSSPALEIMEQNDWDFFITMQDESAPALQKKFAEDILMHKENSLRRQIDGYLYEYSWTGAVKHDFCKENTKYWLFKIILKITDPAGKSTTFAYITNNRPNKQNIEFLVNEGGRQRWKIENQGFNYLKNHGMELEHGFGTIGNCLLNYFLLRLVAMIIVQLMVYSDMFRKLQGNELIRRPTLKPCLDFFKSFKVLASKLLLSWLTKRTSLPDISKWRVRINST